MEVSIKYASDDDNDMLRGSDGVEVETPPPTPIDVTLGAHKFATDVHDNSASAGADDDDSVADRANTPLLSDPKVDTLHHEDATEPDTRELVRPAAGMDVEGDVPSAETAVTSDGELGDVGSESEAEGTSEAEEPEATVEVEVDDAHVRDAMGVLHSIGARSAQVELRIEGLRARARFVHTLVAGLRILQPAPSRERFVSVRVLASSVRYQCAAQVEELTRLLLACDNVLAMGSEQIRTARKQAVQRVQALLPLAEALTKYADRVLALHSRMEATVRGVEEGAQTNIEVRGRTPRVASAPASSSCSEESSDTIEVNVEKGRPTEEEEQDEDGEEGGEQQADAHEGEEEGPAERAEAVVEEEDGGDTRFVRTRQRPLPARTPTRRHGLPGKGVSSVRPPAAQRIVVPTEMLPRWQPRSTTRRREDGGLVVVMHLDGVREEEVRAELDHRRSCILLAGVKYPTRAELVAARRGAVPSFGYFEASLQLDSTLDPNSARTRWAEEEGRRFFVIEVSPAPVRRPRAPTYYSSPFAHPVDPYAYAARRAAPSGFGRRAPAPFGWSDPFGWPTMY